MKIEPAVVEEDVGKVEEIADEEARRLRQSRRRLSRKWSGLRERYPTADRLSADVEAVHKAYGGFLDAIGSMDWTGVLDGLGRQIDAVLDGAEQGDPTLNWDRDRGVFGGAGSELVWRGDEEMVVDVAGWIERPLAVDEVSTGHGEKVSYPIIFTHQVEANLRAIARAIGWGATIVSAARRLRERGGDHKLVLRRHGESFAIGAASTQALSRRPTAEDFGFDDHGELFRRIDDFDQIDADAHWIRWMEKRQRAPQEVRILREQSGRRLRIEMDRQLRRMRIIDEPATAVVRKRRHVFAEPGKARIEDRYVAAVDDLDAALNAEIAHRLQDGFRIIHQEFKGPEYGGEAQAETRKD